MDIIGEARIQPQAALQRNLALGFGVLGLGVGILDFPSPVHEPCNADIPVCGFAGHSCPAFPAELHGLATGKSPEPADRNVCATHRSGAQGAQEVRGNLSIGSCSIDFCFSGLFIRRPGIYRGKSRRPKAEPRKKSENRRPKRDNCSGDWRAFGFRASGFFRISDFDLRIYAAPTTCVLVWSGLGAGQGFAIHPLTPVGPGIYSPHEPPGRRQIRRVRGASKKSEFLPRYEKKQAFYPAGLCRAGLVIG